MDWLMNNIIGIVGIIISGIIAYHVYYLSRKLDFKDRLIHKDNIRKSVESLLQKIRAGTNSKVELVNIKKYLTHYPHTNNEDSNGFTYFGAELKALRFDGIEFFCAVKEIYRKPNGSLSLTDGEGFTREKKNIFEVGVIPYEWIEYIDGHGDEFSYRPQFFCKFNGLHKTPYKYAVYYKESDAYHEGSDPMDMKWKSINVSN